MFVKITYQDWGPCNGVRVFVEVNEDTYEVNASCKEDAQLMVQTVIQAVKGEHYGN